MTKATTKAKTERVTKAPEGTPFVIDGDAYTVGPKCDQNNGRWVCVTHGTVLQNQFQKDIHIDGTRKHVLAWFCGLHGAEVP